MPTSFDSKRLSKSLQDDVDRVVTQERAFAILKEIADTNSPSQALQFTRAPVIGRLLNSLAPNVQFTAFDSNFRGTGNTMLMFGEAPDILVVAHADEISYLVAGEGGVQRVELLPFCAHRARQPWPALALRYASPRASYQVIARGILESGMASGYLAPAFKEPSAKVEIGDRIIFDHPMTLDESRIVHGKVDNAVGVAACILATLALATHAEMPRVWFAFTDEEEGPPDGNSTFARGARRLIHALEVPSDILVIVVDGHDVNVDAPLLPTALFTEKESKGRGNIVPPDLYAAFKRLTPHLRRRGVQITENSDYVARSDSPALMERFRNLLQFGYSVKDAHFDTNVPSASLEAVVALAKALAYTLTSKQAT